MALLELDKLVRIGKLKAEPPAASKLADLLHSGTVRLADAQRSELSRESRFDLAYNAAHAFSLAALRRHGYRSENRYLVFQSLRTPWGCRPRNGGCWTPPTASATWRNTRATSKWTRPCLMPCCG